MICLSLLLVPAALSAPVTDNNDKFDNVETEARAKEHCENFYFHLGATIDEVFFSYLASGGQSDVYKCGVDQNEPKIEPDKVAIKMYQRPWEMNVTELEIIDTAMGEAGVGAKIYEFFATGKIEEFLDDYRNFEWVENEDEEDWGHQGCDECMEPEVYRQTARLFAHFHTAHFLSPSLHELELKYDSKIWPWNTKLAREHLMQEWYQSDGKPRWIARRLGIATSQLPYEYDWAQMLYDTVESPIIFSHSDAHPGNMMVKNGEFDAATMKLIDYDNASWAYRGFDFIYHIIMWPVWPKLDIIHDFMDTYIEEFELICRQFDCQSPTRTELMNEFRRSQPYAVLMRLHFNKAAFGIVFEKEVEAYLDAVEYWGRTIGTPI